MIHTLVAGDQPLLQWTLTDGDGSVLDLTDFTVTLRLLNLRDGPDAIENEMSIVDAENGLVEYRFEADEVNFGVLTLEVAVTDAQDQTSTSPPVIFRVRAKLGD